MNDFEIAKKTLYSQRCKQMRNHPVSFLCLWSKLSECKTIEKVVITLNKETNCLSIERLKLMLKDYRHFYTDEYYYVDINLNEYEDEFEIITLIIYDHLKRLLTYSKKYKWRTNDFHEFILIPIKYLHDIIVELKTADKFHGIIKAVLLRLKRKYYFEPYNLVNKIISYLERKGYTFPFDDLESVTASGIHKRNKLKRKREYGNT